MRIRDWSSDVCSSDLYARGAGFDDVFAHGMLVMAYLGLMIEEAGPPEGIRSLSTRFVAITQLNARITCKAHVADVGEDEIGLDLVADDELGHSEEGRVGIECVSKCGSWGYPYT